MDNNIFSIRRFALYASKHYWEDRYFYLLMILATAIILTPLITKFTFMPEEIQICIGNGVHVMSRLRDNFTQIFYSIGFIFSMAVMSRSAYGAKKDILNMNSMLLPVSFQERFWFMILNTVVVANVVFIIIFYVSSSYVESLYLFSDSRYVFQGVIPLGSDFVTDNLESRNIFSFSDLLPNPQAYPKYFRVIGISIAIYLFCISVVMWGAVASSRQKRGQETIVMLSHVVFLALLVVLIIRISNGLLAGIESHSGGLVLVDGDNVVRSFIRLIAPVSFIPSFVYFFVAYKKLKTLEVYK